MCFNIEKRHLFFIKWLDFFIVLDRFSLIIDKETRKIKSNIFNKGSYYLSNLCFSWYQQKKELYFCSQITLILIELLWSIYQKTLLIFTNVYLTKASTTKCGLMFFIVLTRLPVLFYAAVVVVVFIAHIPFTQRKEEKNEIVTFMY